ncbi:Putative NADH-flavin reductase [Saccharopolyspora antimicrobica]|uniref:NADH-flavin reductase n=1 Tax=Saccharopolyspora antimicrobica TaxID=455193 RepID=A0A1I5I2F4_9PSEU|nr:SDR family oxidoreductase [Saccharopolyspora antimicrobica]RKT83079.1 putative NADH-flavin reductase [Saccharopolyspora antimicrobica]SFO54713.1 Putative NADH-flavin reductase [Saccharopolyspora antimicrobica]
MRITIFGATGGTGKHLLDQALSAGHQVTAVVRDPAKVTREHPGLAVVRADVMDPADIRPHIAGRDAVISAIGSTSLRNPTAVQTDSTASILDAMGAAGVRRFLVVSNGGIVTDGDDVLTRRLVKPIMWRFLKHPWTDMQRMEEIVRASSADWTIIRPPRLTEGPRTGRYRSAVERAVRGGMKISRADLADSILRSLHDDSSIRSAIAVAD